MMETRRNLNTGFFEPCWVPIYPEVVETIDTRDLRDPQKLGERLDELQLHLEVTEERSHPLTEVYDSGVLNRWIDVPNYPQDESMCMLTQREYRAELEARKAAGDKYAASAIESIDAGKGVQGYEPV